jgi:hypothetical protein
MTIVRECNPVCQCHQILWYWTKINLLEMKHAKYYTYMYIISSAGFFLIPFTRWLKWKTSISLVINHKSLLNLLFYCFKNDDLSSKNHISTGFFLQPRLYTYESIWLIYSPPWSRCGWNSAVTHFHNSEQ